MIHFRGRIYSLLSHSPMLVASKYHSPFRVFIVVQKSNLRSVISIISMQYLPFKIMMYVVIGLKSNYVFASDVTKANEQSTNQVKLEFVL